MDMKRSLLRAGLVLAVALGAGHLMQKLADSRTHTAELATPQPKKIEKVSAGPQAAPAPSPAAPQVALAALTAETPKLPPLTLLPRLPVLAPPAAAKPAPEASVAPDCTPRLSLTATPRAMITLALNAPCAPGQRVVLRHAGLVVAERLDAKGQLSLDLPALDDAGQVSVLFSDASITTASAALPDTPLPRRFAVQWMADDSFQLRAVEAGQHYGDPDNVSTEAPVSARGGYLISLGDPTLDLPMLAQIYTWPADAKTTADPVIEAAVTEVTCGRDLLGETVQSRDGKATVTELTVAMPGCDALGDILVLNNLAGNVTLAAQN
ncbi:hypothetical protein [Neotabrizicola sp. sgz301269]|uniref:hypothetical protein n=1 Tax=Neotabrizicola sp. sgz301269 TaxID=3276282 RepID=UPI00376FD7A9